VNGDLIVDARGQTMGLLGRNGRGQSTLIRTLLGHVAQRDGHITLLGKDAPRLKPHAVARLGLAYVPEGRGVFPNLTTWPWCRKRGRWCCRVRRMMWRAARRCRTTWGFEGLEEFSRGKCGGSPRGISTSSYQFRSEWLAFDWDRAVRPAPDYEVDQRIHGRSNSGPGDKSA
jgi:hypothetical protein